MTKQGHWVSARGCVYNVYYHFVWSTKYRRKVLVGSIAEDLHWLHELIAKQKSITLIDQEMEIMPDHVHLFVTAHPIFAPAKEENPELKGVHSQVLQEVVKRVDLAYQAFFRRVKEGEDPGYPRFKGRDRYDSFTYTQTGFSLEPGKLWLSKIGDIKIKLHRAIEGDIQRLSIRRMPTGKWFVSFPVELDESLPKTGLSIGVDVGLKSFITLSNGEHVDNPRFFVHEENALARLYGDQENARERCLQICAQAKEIEGDDLNPEIKVFKALADATRLKILKILIKGELCICEIMLALKKPQSSISHNLSIFDLNWRGSACQEDRQRLSS